MKKFLQKVFFWHSPEKGAFWSLVLLLLGSWLLGTAFVFTSYRMTLCSTCCFNGRYVAIDWRIVPASVVALLFVVNFLFQSGRFWFSARKKAWDLACKKWLLCSALLWGAALSCSGYCILLAGRTVWCDGGFSYVKAEGASLPLFLTVSVVLLGMSVLATGKFYSAVGKFSCKEIFTLPVRILAALTVVVYIGMISASLILQKKCETEQTALEKHFGRPFTAEALKAWGSRKADAAFWKRIAELCQKDKNKESFYGFAEFTPAQLASWRKRFASSKEYAELDRMISLPLPSYPRKFEKYNYFAESMPDLSLVRTMTRLQVWHCRFAAETKDRAAAMAALKRIDNLSAYLSDQPWLLSALVNTGIKSYKVRAVETLLGAKILSEADLLALKQQSSASVKQLAAGEKYILGSEALAGLDFMEGAFYAEKWEGIKIVPGKKFRFLLPQHWLIYEGNRLNVLRWYGNAENFYDIKDVRANSVFCYFANQLMPSFQATANRFLQFKLEQQAMVFFIKQELFRLKNGKLPDDLPLPVDPFSKKAMKYTHGQVTIEKEFYEKEQKKITIPGRQLTSTAKNSFKVTVTIPDREPTGVSPVMPKSR